MRGISNAVSIPIGFSSSLQLPPTPREARRRKRFNPYRVFKFVATLYILQIKPNPPSFQSLSGFQVRCNVFQRWLITSPRRSFNPYRVFKFVATRRQRARWLLLYDVSIPIGFSSSLQPRGRMELEEVEEWFQSLSGFQVRCNGNGANRKRNRSVCFNPYRVFKFVATRAVDRHRFCGPHSFNPYRVFKFVATSCYICGGWTGLTGFNPYRVFKFVATYAALYQPGGHSYVSIPIGFSSSLQPPSGPISTSG